MFHALKLELAIAIAALTFASHGARADAIYTWQPISGDMTAHGSVSITDDAYFAGSATFGPYFNHDPVFPFPGSDITTFTFWLYGLPMGSVTPVPNLYGTYSFDLTVGNHDLTGGISSNNGSSDVIMGGGDVWTVNQADSDNGDSPCYHHPNNCSGTTGRWVLQSAPTRSSNVPEPASAGLLLGGMAMLFKRRRA